jgi:hypothetical protein
MAGFAFLKRRTGRDVHSRIPRMTAFLEPVGQLRVDSSISPDGSERLLPPETVSQSAPVNDNCWPNSPRQGQRPSNTVCTIKSRLRQQKRYREFLQEALGLARNHAIPIFFAPPLSIGGKVNGGTGFALQLSSGSFVVTASHVLSEYAKRRESGEVLHW